MTKYLSKKVQVKAQAELTVKQIIIQLSVCLILGALLGVIAKYSDTIPSNSTMGGFFNFISSITTRLGLWVLLATIIAARSRSPKLAALNVLAFFVGMLIAYYMYSQMLFGFFPTYYFLRWGIIAIASPAAAYVVWFGRGKGWFAVFCGALPIGLLFSLGFSFFYVFSAVLAFDLLAAILLLLILPKQEYLKVAAIGVVIAFIISRLNILSYLLGGL